MLLFATAGVELAKERRRSGEKLRAARCVRWRELCVYRCVGGGDEWTGERDGDEPIITGLPDVRVCALHLGRTHATWASHAESILSRADHAYLASQGTASAGPMRSCTRGSSQYQSFDGPGSWFCCNVDLSQQVGQHNRQKSNQDPDPFNRCRK